MRARCERHDLAVGKVAFETLLTYPEVFRGALLASGIHYYRQLPERSSTEGHVWYKRFDPPRDVEAAKLLPIAITTGPNDMNFQHISDVAAGMLEDGFTAVALLSIDGHGHAPPPADAFERALTWLDTH